MKASGWFTALSICAGVVLKASADVLPTAQLDPVHVRVRDFNLINLEETAKVTVIDRASLEAAGAMSIPDLLQREANLRLDSFSGDASQGQISMRGFGENSGLRLLVIVDGQRLNRPDMGAIDWQLLPIDDIESIEVIHGGQNVLYGNNALAGVIQINTRRGGESRTTARAEIGSFGHVSGGLDHTGGDGEWFWDTGVSGQRVEGYRENSETWNRGASATLGRDFGLGSSQTVSVSGVLAEGSVQFPGGLLYEEFIADPRQSTNGGDSESEHLTGLFSAHWESDQSWGSARSGASVQFRELRWALSGNYAQNDQFSASLVPRIRVGGIDRYWIGGVDLLLDCVDYSSFLTAQRVVEKSSADLSRTTFGPYIFTRQPLGEALFLTTGLRYEIALGSYENVDYDDSQLLEIIETNRGPRPNPNYQNPPDVDPLRSYDKTIVRHGPSAEISIGWNLTDAIGFRLGYDRVYRYPALDEVAAYQGYDLGSDDTNPMPFNRDLDAEVGNQLEVGLIYSEKGWNASASLYYLELDGEIAFDPEENLNVNLGDTRRFGLDFDIGYQTDRWGVSTRWSFVDARFTDGVYFADTGQIELEGRFVPLVPWAHGVTSAWVKPVEPLEVAVYYSLTSDRWQGNDYANNNFSGDSRRISAFDRTDVRVSLELDPVTIFLRVNNLLNAKNAPLAVRESFYPAPGRDVRIGAMIEF